MLTKNGRILNLKESKRLFLLRLTNQKTGDLLPGIVNMIFQILHEKITKIGHLETLKYQETRHLMPELVIGKSNVKAFLIKQFRAKVKTCATKIVQQNNSHKKHPAPFCHGIFVFVFLKFIFIPIFICHNLID